jgi:alkyl hydroperoxide reductase subunit D
MTLEALRARIPDAARDIRLNLQSVLQGGPLTAEQRWGVAIATAIASRHAELARAVVDEARKHVGDAVIDDAVAAASLMAMNNVYYRFRHLVGKESYGTKRAGLRMNRLVQPATSKVDFELLSLAVSAINGCGTCMAAHEAVVVTHGLTEEHVHDAVRVASVVHAAAIALETATLLAQPNAPQEA